MPPTMLARGMLSRVLWLVLITCALPRVSFAQALEVPVPALSGPLNDYAQVAGGHAVQLQVELERLHAHTGVQFVVLTLPTLEGEPIATFAHRVMEAWRLGSPKSDLGLLLVIVPNDRLTRLETGYGLEGALPDATCKQLLADVLAPKADAKGSPQNISGSEVLATVRAVGEILRKNKALGLLPEATPVPPTQGMPWWWPWALLALVAVIFVAARALMAALPSYGDTHVVEPYGAGRLGPKRRGATMRPGFVRWLLELLAIVLSGGGRGGPPQGGGGYSGGGGRSGGGGASDRY